MYFHDHHGMLRDFGPEPLVRDLEQDALCNNNFRTALWTGPKMQLTLMCIPVGDSIGLECHEDTDQFLCLVQGCAMVQFGKTKDTVHDVSRVSCHDGIFVPAGTWHNVRNCGNVPLKLYSIYAPPHHPFGTVQQTKEDAFHGKPKGC
ncbi:MAG: cupin domain-containing protein [Oscillospiraceae bacterium]|nr:cupin domain-containing protein [Oscillospiraceae bacterium]